MQETDAIDLRHDVATCRGCGARRVLCAHGACTQCHRRAPRQMWYGIMREDVVHLCCGWWGTRDVLPWTCITCGTVRTRRRA
jgi:hypothetical protein